MRLYRTKSLPCLGIIIVGAPLVLCLRFGLGFSPFLVRIGGVLGFRAESANGRRATSEGRGGHVAPAAWSLACPSLSGSFYFLFLLFFWVLVYIFV
jgi:hypothetical protein